MTKERHGRFIRLLSGILLLSACCLFLISMFQPFLVGYAIYVSSGHESSLSPSEYYWSFQMVTGNKVFAFNSYWFQSNYDLMIQLTQAPMLLLAMLLFQIVTVTLGLLSLGLRKGWMKLIPLVSSGIVILLMITVNNELARYYIYGQDYEMGYWLVYPSMLLFLLTFITSLVARKKKTKSSSMSHQQTEL